MSKLTKAESKWIKDVQDVLRKCPSKRIGFYTIGDNNIVAYDFTKRNAIYDEMDAGRASDFGPAAENVDARFHEELWFPNPVESTAG